MNQKIALTINYINLFSALSLAAISILSFTPLLRIVYYTFFISYFLELFLDKKWNNIHFDKKSVFYITMLFFFLLALISYPFDKTHLYFHILLNRRYSLLGFAFVGFFCVNKLFKINYFLNTFIITSVVVIIYLIFYRIGIFEFLLNDNRSEVFSSERIKYINNHMMFDFFLNISLISTWYILTMSWKRTIWWKRFLYFVSLTVIYGILSISEGRSGFIAGSLLILSFIFFEMWKRRKMIGIIIGLLIPFLLVGIISNHKRMSEKEIKAEPRIFLWKSAISVIKESPVIGYGISNAQEHFDIARTKYQTVEFNDDSKKSKLLDSHSQYLQTTMEFGILGFLILIFLYVYPFFIADKNRKVFSALILLLCVNQSVFDMFITGQFSTLFCILMILILSVENNVAQNKKQLHT